MKAAIYARVSTEDQHLDNQLDELRRFAAQQGWTVVREFTDKASAKNGERIGWKQLWKDVSAHRFDILLFWSLDSLNARRRPEDASVPEAADRRRREVQVLHRAIRRFSRNLRRRNYWITRRDRATGTSSHH